MRRSVLALLRASKSFKDISLIAQPATSLEAVKVLCSITSREIRLPTAFEYRTFSSKTPETLLPPSGSSVPPPPPSAADGTIEITTPQSFQSLLQLSTTTPIVLDAYADWCGPCKQLEPLLIQTVAAQNGKVILAKLNIESESEALQQIIQGLQIASVPTLFMVMQGRIVDVINGVPQPAALQQWVAKAVAVMSQIAAAPGAGDPTSQHDQQELIANPQIQQQPQDPKELRRQGFVALRTPGAKAEAIAPFFGAVLDSSVSLPEDKAAATAGLAVCAILEGKLDVAQEAVESAKATAGEASVEEVSAAEAWVMLAKEASEKLSSTTETSSKSSVEDLQSAAQSNTKDPEMMYLLALKCFAEGKLSEATDAALQIVRRDKEWNEQAGKRLVTALCDVMGSSSDTSKAARRRLSNLWFI